MTLIKWDETGDRLYETGVDRGTLYVYDSDKKEYGTPTPWNGLTTVTETPSGAEPNAIYADNIKYLELTSREEFGGTIEAYTYPEEFAACDGSLSVGGLSVGQQARKQFAFSYRTRVGNDTQGDDHGYKLHVVFGAKAQPSEKTRSTVNDTPEPTTMSWTFTTTPSTFDFQPDVVEGLSPDLKEFAENLRPTSYFVFDSTKTDPAVMRSIEELLWDTESGIKDAEKFLAQVFQLIQGEAEAEGPTGDDGTGDDGTGTE